MRAKLKQAQRDLEQAETEAAESRAERETLAERLAEARATGERSQAALAQQQRAAESDEASLHKVRGCRGVPLIYYHGCDFQNEAVLAVKRGQLARLTEMGSNGEVGDGGAEELQTERAKRAALLRRIAEVCFIFG